jgi:FKBP-type peptidyl-prolyl cis-trans isomerase
MAAPRAQRIGIWIIAIVLTVGTIGSFVVIVLANSNQKIDAAQQQKDYEKQLADYQTQQKEAAKLNEGIEGYIAEPFDASAVTNLKVETLTEGTGEVVKNTDSINVSYFGWISDGSIFDSSKKKDTADAPITLSLSSDLIAGWKEGLPGQKVGSIVRLTIPAAKAYATQASGIIPANSPLVFIVKINKIDNTAAN